MGSSKNRTVHEQQVVKALVKNMVNGFFFTSELRQFFKYTGTMVIDCVGV